MSSISHGRKPAGKKPEKLYPPGPPTGKIRAIEMGYYSTELCAETRAEKTEVTPKKCVMGSRPSCVCSRPELPLQVLETTSENTATLTIIVSGLPCWPSRDLIGEEGSINLHLFCENGSVNHTDSFGHELTAFMDSVNTLRLKPKSLPGDQTGLCDAQWSAPIGAAEGKCVSISGYMTVDLYHDPDEVADPYAPRERRRNTADHERLHARQYKVMWNKLKADADALEGKWCPTACAKLAADRANILWDLYNLDARILADQTDSEDYGGGDRGEQNKISRENAFTRLVKVMSDMGLMGCKKLTGPGCW